MRLRHISRKPAFILGWLFLFVVSVTLVTMLPFGTSQSAVAQEDIVDDVPPDDGGGGAVPDDGGGAADGGADEADAGGDGEEDGTTYLSWMFEALGIPRDLHWMERRGRPHPVYSADAIPGLL